MAEVKKKACKECPYRKDSAEGWLGSSDDPQEFLQQLNYPEVHPCHMEVDWEDDENLEENIEDAHICTGAIQFMNNDCKLSRYPKIRALQDEVGEDSDIIKNRRDFINHHTL